MSPALVEPAAARKPIIVDGRSWMEVEFITISMIPAWVATPLPLSRRFIAAIPSGVDALPRPSMFDDMLSAMYFSVSMSFILKIFFIKGCNNFASLALKPLASTSSKIPSQTA